jgi:2-hydroxy-6-oxonona-2,4-dienedioate hydrolase
MRNSCRANDFVRMSVAQPLGEFDDTPRMRPLWHEVSGQQIYAAAAGEGRPVVLVHGFGVSGTYMLPLARLLSASFESFVIDLPGQGKSGKRRGPGGIGDLAETLGEWQDAVGLARPAFVANSMGCQIVAELAVRRPRRVGPLVLVGPTVDPARRGARRQLLGVLRDAAHEPLSMIALAARDEATAGIGALLATARSALADRIEDRLPLIRQTSVVVVGEDDGFLGLEWAQRVAKLLPRGRLVRVPGEPHAVHYTRPRLVAAIVSELLLEEAEHGRRDLVGRLEHRNVPAGNALEPGSWHGPLPRLADTEGHDSVALSPDE